MNSKYETVDELAQYYENLSRDIPHPKSPSRPARENYPSHAAHGLALDAFEEEVAQWKEQRREYRNTSNRITSLFKADLLEFLEISDHPKAEKLWELAWEAGHANGYIQVALYAEEFSELMK